ncbi:hypothetical protein [Thalassovita sp.]|uniref:hypothetical protein n=1 Tax=Thalassovita sp. TaxID=1979401 RepID=UPI002B273074|nr:hypothetical protein [Thalassovita sp.]
MNKVYYAIGISPNFGSIIGFGIAQTPHFINKYPSDICLDQGARAHLEKSEGIRFVPVAGIGVSFIMRGNREAIRLCEFLNIPDCRFTIPLKGHHIPFEDP